MLPRQLMSYGNKLESAGMAWVPFIEDFSEVVTSGLVAGSYDSVELA